MYILILIGKSLFPLMCDPGGFPVFPSTPYSLHIIPPHYPTPPPLSRTQPSH